MQVILFNWIWVPGSNEQQYCIKYSRIFFLFIPRGKLQSLNEFSSRLLTKFNAVIVTTGVFRWTITRKQFRKVHVIIKFYERRGTNSLSALPSTSNTNNALTYFASLKFCPQTVSQFALRNRKTNIFRHQTNTYMRGNRSSGFSIFEL